MGGELYGGQDPGALGPQTPWDAAWSRIARRLERSGDCWRWQGPTTQGYGQIKVGRHNQQVHRVAYIHFIGPIPEGKILDHQCHNRDAGCPGGVRCPHRACCNPAHMEPVTRRDHVLRGKTVNAINAAKASCRNGHAFDAENTYIAPGTRRRKCRRCHALRRAA